MPILSHDTVPFFQLGWNGLFHHVFRINNESNHKIHVCISSPHPYGNYNNDKFIKPDQHFDIHAHQYTDVEIHKPENYALVTLTYHSKKYDSFNDLSEQEYKIKTIISNAIVYANNILTVKNGPHSQFNTQF